MGASTPSSSLVLKNSRQKLLSYPLKNFSAIGKIPQTLFQK